MAATVRASAGSSQTVFLAVGLMAVIAMMILPMPSWVLDVGLAASFALAILIFTITLFIERPLDFSAFPTVLLASLVLRLALNVSSTKLIIGEGHTGTNAAGNVIEGFAMFVMNGSLFLGLVVFCVLLIVNFVVINKGATRMAEVGARFALDGMPGKQLAIDSDMSAGAINHEEAKKRRELEQAETSFFGSLDGASKFVKGDAIAGLLITLLNLVVGLIIGIVVHDMPLNRAFETYSILTVGDGLVNQIPAVVISISSAMLLARGGATGATDTTLGEQLGRYPAALGTVAALMALFALVPGLPFVPFVLGAIILALIAVASRNRILSAKDLSTEDEAPKPRVTSMGDILDLDDIHVEFSPDLVEMVLDPATGLDARISNMRNHIAVEFGLLLPEIRLTDNSALQPGQYIVKVQGVEQSRDVLYPDKILALLGDPPSENPIGLDVSEPVYGAAARWISKEDQEVAALEGLTTVTPTEVLATHLLELMKRNFPRLLTHKALRRLLNEMTNLSDAVRSDENRRLLDELIPDKITIDLLLSVLRSLLDELVSIRNLPMIIEAAAEGRQLHSSVEGITEHVRQRLGFQLVSALKREDGTIPLIQLSPEWEDLFKLYQIQGDRGQLDVALPPNEFNRLAGSIAEKVNQVSETGTNPVLVTSTKRRRFLRTVLTPRVSRIPFCRSKNWV